jgi:hypothetical protein
MTPGVAGRIQDTAEPRCGRGDFGDFTKNSVALPARIGCVIEEVRLSAI